MIYKRTLKQLTFTSDHEELRSSVLIFEQTQKVAGSFLTVYKTLRGASLGGPRDNEQDVLRAMLIFTSAGIDSLVKQLLSDTLKVIVDKNEAAGLQLQKYTIERLSRTNKQTGQKEIDFPFLSTVLTSISPRASLVTHSINNFVSKSMQSKEEILGASAAFAIPTDSIIKNNLINDLENTFKTRNDIVHEMDIDFTKTNRKRRHRKFTELVYGTNLLMHVAHNFLKEIDKILSECE